MADLLVPRTWRGSLSHPGTVRSPAAPSRLLLSLLTTVWVVVAAVVAAVGTLAAVRDPGPLVTFVVAGIMGLVVGGFTFAFGREDWSGVARALRAAAWAVIVTVVAIGLGRLLGGLSAVVLAGLLLTSPVVPATLRWFGRRRRATTQPDGSGPGEPDHPSSPEQVDAAPAAADPEPPAAALETVGGVDMTDFEVALLSTEHEVVPEPAEEEDGALSSLDLDELCRIWRRSTVLLRQHLDGRRLAEVLDARQRCLDELLRRHPAGTRAWLSAGGSAAADPRPFLTQEPESI